MAEKICDQVALALASGTTPLLLSGTDRCGLTLFGHNFHHPGLRGSSLPRAHLSQPDLRRADGSGANLTRANLQGADLSQVAQEGLLKRLQGTQLVRTILSER
jgi:uncharacterized protein YjbI with pentapeptide repeats